MCSFIYVYIKFDVELDNITRQALSRKTQEKRMGINWKEVEKIAQDKNCQRPMAFECVLMLGKEEEKVIIYTYFVGRKSNELNAAKIVIKSTIYKSLGC